MGEESRKICTCGKCEECLDTQVFGEPGIEEGKGIDYRNEKNPD